MIIKRKHVVSTEKDYSLISDLYHSGVKRTGQKYIGKARVKIANALQKSIDKDRAKIRKADEIIINAHSAKPEITNKLIRSGKEKFNTRVLSTSNLQIPDVTGSFITDSTKAAKVVEGSLANPSIKESKKRGWRKIANTKGKNDLLVFLGEGKDGIMSLPHELGHVENSVLSGGESKKKAEAALRTIENNDTGLSAFIKKSKAGLVDIKEEKSATKNGLRMLREVGVGKNDLKIAKKEGKAGIDSHRFYNKAKGKSALRDSLELKYWKEGDRTTSKRITRDIERKEKRRAKK